MVNQISIQQNSDLTGLENYLKLEILRKQNVYVWAFPIRYPDKTTYGWEYEFPDGRTSWYNEECLTYEDALSIGIKTAEETLLQDRLQATEGKQEGGSV